METTTPAAGSSPASTPVTPAAPANPTPAPAPSVQTTPAPANTPNARDVASVLTSDERKAIVTGQTTLQAVLQSKAGTSAAAQPAPSAPAEPPATPASAEPATPAATEPAAGENDEDPQSGADPKAPDRFRFKDAADQAVALIAKTKGISLVAAAKIYAADNPTTDPAAPAKTTPAAPAPDPELARYDTRLAELEATQKKLSDERKAAREDVDMEKADSLSDKIHEVLTEIGMLKNERQGFVRNRETATAQSYEQQANASRDQVIATYPELQAEGSLHRLALDAYVAKALADPKRAPEFKDPTWPAKLGEEFAQAHGLKKPGSVPAKPATTPAPAATLRSKPVQVPGAKLLSSSDGTPLSASATANVNGKELLAQLASMTPAQRAELRRGIPAAPRI